MTLEERIAELETRLAFEEHTVQSLSDTVATQAQELARLRLELGALQQRMRSLAPGAVGPREDEPPPPHY